MKAPKLSSSSGVNPTHYNGGVASAAFESFKTMDPSAFLSQPSSKRGRPVNTALIPNMPKLSGKNEKPLKQPSSLDLILGAFDNGKKLKLSRE